MKIENYQKNKLVKIALPVVFLFCSFLFADKAFASATLQKVRMNSLNLIGYWTLDGTDINWTANTTIDRSTGGNAGTLVNMSTTTSPVIGQSGQGLYFDGSNDTITAGDIAAFDTATSLTGCAWVKHNTLTTDDVIMAKNNSATDGVQFFRDDVAAVSARTDTYTISVFDSADTDSASLEGATNASVAGVWKHVCFTFSAGSATGLRLYVNGVEDANSPVSVSSVGAINGGANVFRIGTLSDGTTSPFDGSLDDVRVYTRVLTAGEINALYQMGGAKFAAPTNKIISGLVGYWTLDGANINWTTNKATDKSTTGNTGTITNMSTTSSPVIGKIKQGLKFDGVNDFISLGTDSVVTNTVTVCAWMQTTTLNTLQYIVSNGSFAFGIDSSNSRILATSDDTSTTVVSATNSITAQDWYHVCAVRQSSGTGSIYINGAQSGSSGSTGTPVDGGISLGIGDRGSNGSEAPFKGLIDDVRIYNRALSTGEIQEIYLMGAGTKINSSPATKYNNGLVGYWTFNGGDITTGNTTGSATNGSSATNDSSFGSIAWVNPSFELTSDNNRASSTLSGTTNTNYLNVNTFGFSIPSNATIAGVTVTIEKRRSGGTTGNARDSVVSLVKGGVVTGDNKADTTTNWGTSDAVATYGSASDGWTAGLTPSDVNASNFGLVLSAKGAAAGANRIAEVDNMNIQITYSTPIVAVDKSGSSHNGTMTNGPTFAIGKVGQALDFDGSDDYVDTGSEWIGTSALTISTWIFPRTAGEGSCGNVISNLSTVLVITCGLGNVIGFSSDNQSTNPTSAAIFPSRYKTWIHVAVTRTSSGTANIYVDGSLSGTANQSSGTPIAGSANVYIGNRSGADQTFDGLIDDVRVYNRVLTATEIKQLYLMGK